MKTYKLHDGMGQQFVVDVERNAFIPFDPANTDYQAYLTWLDGYEMVNGELVKTSEGNTPLPADEVTE